MFKNNSVQTIEDCLELLVGLREQSQFQIESSDYNILTSIARQVFRGIGLTDRQHALVKEKLLSYKSQFTALEYPLVLDNTRLPLREIDRSRWVGFRSIESTDYIAVRFSFNKKLISVIDSLRTSENKKLYNEQDKIHYFSITESNILKIIKLLEDKNFVIEPDIKEKYEVIKLMDENKNNYIPGIYGFKLKNLHQKAVEYIISDIGQEPNVDNLALYSDRKSLYGISHFDSNYLDQSISNLTTLSQKLVRRNSTHVLVNKSQFTVSHLAESVLELNRYPLLVCLNNSSDLDDLQEVFHTFRNIFSSDDFCVLYRKDNDTAENIYFNTYIKNNSLNNALATNTKIVYTTQDKLVKTLLKTDWRPKAALVFGSSRSNKMQTYLNELDLVMYYDNDVSPFLREKIEKL